MDLQQIDDNILFKIFEHVPVDTRGQCLSLSRFYSCLLSNPAVWFNFSFDGVAAERRTVQLAAGAVSRALGQTRTLVLSGGILDAPLSTLVTDAGNNIRLIDLTDLPCAVQTWSNGNVVVTEFDSGDNGALSYEEVESVLAVAPVGAVVRCDVACTSLTATLRLIRSNPSLEIVSLLLDCNDTWGEQDDRPAILDEKEWEEGAIEEAFREILNHPHLLVVEVNCCDFLSGRIVQLLCDRRLDGLHLVDCSFRSEWLPMFSGALKDGLCFLTVRELDGNAESQPFLNKVVAAEFVEAVRESTTLKHLSVGGFTFRQSVASKLFRACTLHPSLSTLYLQECTFDDDAAEDEDDDEEEEEEEEDEDQEFLAAIRALFDAAPDAAPERVNLWRTRLRSDVLESTDALHSMLEGVKSSTSLRSLVFSPRGLRGSLTEAEANMVRQCVSLRHVECHSQALSDEIAARV
jgi:hypothetical protein